MIILEAHAKVNISLDVLGKREDGYHNLKMIMQTIGLHDTITIKEIPSDIEIKCNAPYVPNNNTNIAYKAAEAMINTYKIKSGVKIEIIKRIPVAAGLAGGSTDAAAVLKGINELFKLNLDQEELMKIGKEIGADVPYCILGGTALAEGIGEKLTVLPKLNKIPIILVKPRIGVSTAWVYKNFNLEIVDKKPDTDLLINALESNNIGLIAKNMVNVLESVTISKYPIIKKIKDDLIKKGALGSIMSGSGPTVFGIFEDEQKAKKAYGSLKRSKHECYLTYIV